MVLLQKRCLSFHQNFVFHGQCTIADNKEATMPKVPKQEYIAEFKEQAVTRVTDVGSNGVR